MQEKEGRFTLPTPALGILQPCAIAVCITTLFSGRSAFSISPGLKLNYKMRTLKSKGKTGGEAPWREEQAFAPSCAGDVSFIFLRGSGTIQ